ncbi:MAG: MBL fold metallo-hydrolase [Chitinophagaceae bacterium]
MHTHFIATDLVKVYKEKVKKKEDILTVLAWGDAVEVIKQTSTTIEIRLQEFVPASTGSIEPVERVGFIFAKSNQQDGVIRPIEDRDVLQVSFVDVQQGDGCIVETPDGKVLLIDGGENQMFARYLAARFQNTSPDNPKDIDCIVVTHGDADHYAGLSEILKSEQHENPRKRLFIRPLRVYHNGIVKRPGKDDQKKDIPDVKLLGPTTKKDDRLYLTGLQDDLLAVPDKELNKFFKEWKSTLKEYADFFGGLEQRRLDHNSQGAFSFLDGMEVEVLGPITENVNGKPALKFLVDPPKSVKQKLSDSPQGSFSASHTINGHSVILRLTYGNIRFLFSGDLNEEAEDILVDQSNSGERPIEAEVLKVPHHGSADFSNPFLEAVKPLISIVSSGDENEQKEYIHPRATLVGALGKHSRTDRPLIFVTEMVAFFKGEGDAVRAEGSKKPFYAFSRSAFGIVHVRTDGERILVFTHSGKEGTKEAYAFTISELGGKVVREDVAIV